MFGDQRGRVFRKTVNQNITAPMNAKMGSMAEVVSRALGQTPTPMQVTPEDTAMAGTGLNYPDPETAASFQPRYRDG